MGEGQIYNNFLNYTGRADHDKCANCSLFKLLFLNLKQMKENYLVLGMMSGTSLDGLDLCLSEFSFGENKISYKILEAATVAYSSGWRKKLAAAQNLNAEQLT